MELTIQQKLLKIFHIKNQEKFIVFWCLLLAFVCGLVQCYLTAIPLALFLVHYSSSMLPEIYISVAIVTLLFGSIYTFFETRLLFKTLNFSLMGFIVATAFIFWLLLSGVNYSSWLLIGLLVWSFLVFDLCDLAIWTVFNRIFMIQQGKRLFGIIGSGQSIGGVIGGLLTPFIIRKIGTENIILMISILVFILIIVMYGLQKRFMTVDNKEQEQDYIESEQKIKLTHIISNHYIIKVFMITLFTICVSYVVDMLFNTVAESHYPNEDTLASFLGIFYGIVDGADFLCSTFLLAWILQRFGLIASLLFSPIVCIIISVFAMVTTMIPKFVILAFWCIVGLNLALVTLQGAINDTGMLLLFQPLKTNLRAWVQSKNETIITPFATCLIGLILFIIGKTVGIHVPLFLALSIILFVAGIVTVWTLKSEYIKALINAINNHHLIKPEFEKLDKTSLPLFKKYLNSSYPGEVIYALSTLEKISIKEFIKALPYAFKSDSPEIKKFALKKVAEYEAYQYLPQIRKLAETEIQDDICGQAILTLVASGRDSVLNWIENQLNTTNLVKKSAVIQALVSFGYENSRKNALHELSNMSSSSNEDERIASANIISNFSKLEHQDILDKLLYDDSSLVRAAALDAVIKLRDNRNYLLIIKNLNELSVRIRIFDALPQLGDEFLPSLKQSYKWCSSFVQNKLIKLLSQMQETDLIKDYLINKLKSKKTALRHTVLQVLAKMHPALTIDFLNYISLQNDFEIKNLIKLQQNYLAIPRLDSTRLLRDLFWRQMQLAIERILLNLTFYYSYQTIMYVKAGLNIGEESGVSYALELLDSLLLANHKKSILPILNQVYIDEPLPTSDSQFHKVLEKCLKDYSDPLKALTCAAAIECIVKLSLKEYVDLMEKLVYSSSSIIRETLAWAFGHMQCGNRLEMLKILVQDADVNVRKEAVNALGIDKNEENHTGF